MTIIDQAKPNDATAICNIRDEAWLVAYPNKELDITVEDIKTLAVGRQGEFLPRRIKYLASEIKTEDGINNITLVARHSDKVIGFVAARTQQGKCWLSNLYVLPEFQGKGVGSMLMTQVLKTFANKQPIFLEVVSYNQNAISFYERFGFKKTSTVVADEDKPSYLVTLPQIEMVLKEKSLEPQA